MKPAWRKMRPAVRRQLRLTVKRWKRRIASIWRLTNIDNDILPARPKISWTTSLTFYSPFGDRQSSPREPGWAGYQNPNSWSSNWNCLRTSKYLQNPAFDTSRHEMQSRQSLDPREKDEPS